MFRPEKEPKINREKGPPQEQGLKEETKREIDQHLCYIKKSMILKLEYRRQKEVPTSLKESESYEKEEKFYYNLFEKAKEQLAAGGAGKEILKIISDFPTEEEIKVGDNLHRHERLLKRQNLDSDKLSPGDTYKKQIDSYKEQIEAERQKRESWAKQLKENWEKR